jgi:hypothetical protein
VICNITWELLIFLRDKLFPLEVVECSDVAILPRNNSLPFAGDAGDRHQFGSLGTGRHQIAVAIAHGIAHAVHHGRGDAGPGSAKIELLDRILRANELWERIDRHFVNSGRVSDSQFPLRLGSCNVGQRDSSCEQS